MIKRLLAIWYLFLPAFIFYFRGPGKNIPTAIYGVTVKSSLLLLCLYCYLRNRAKSNSASWLILLAQFTFLFVADLIFNYRLLYHIETYDIFKRLSGLSYSLFMLANVIFVLYSYKNNIKTKIENLASLFTFVVYGYLTLIYIVIPYHNRIPTFPLFHQVTNFTYSILSVCLASLVVPMSFRVVYKRDFFYLQSLILMLFSDFCLRYQTGIMNWKVYPWASPGWLIGISAFLLIILDDVDTPPLTESKNRIANFVSIRAAFGIASKKWTRIQPARDSSYWTGVIYPIDE